MKNPLVFSRGEIILYFFFVALASILLSLLTNLKSDIVNNDAICYLQSAEMLGKYGFDTAMHICDQAKWPFYSMLIFTVVKLSHISYIAAANLINAFFSLITVFAFIAIVRELGGDRRVFYFAALVILLAHEFNSVRNYIVRDHGFWACYLLSMFFLLRYFYQLKWIYALLFSLSLLIASLFRVEGVIFLLFLPWLSFFAFNYSFAERCKSFIALNSVNILVGSIIMLWLFYANGSLEKLGRLSEITIQLHHGLAQIIGQFQATKSALSHYIFTGYSSKEVGYELFFMLTGLYLLSVAINLSLIYCFLLLYAFKHNVLALSRRAHLVLTGYIVINVLITFAFLLEHLFFSRRYLIALTLVLMLWVPFALDNMWQRFKEGHYRIVLPLVMIAILLSSLGGIFDFGYSKNYVRQAGAYLAAQPATSSIYSNDLQLMYYSNHFGNTLFEKARDYSDLNAIAGEKWKQYDYLAFRFEKKNAEKMAFTLDHLFLNPIQIFANKRGDQVRIYQVPHKETIS